MEKDKIVTIAISSIVIITIAIATFSFSQMNQKDFTIYMKECNIYDLLDMSNYQLFIQTGCPNCDKQLLELEDVVFNLTLIDCTKQGKYCFDEGIIKVPTIINKETNESYKGFQEFSFLNNIINKTKKINYCTKKNEVDNLLIEKQSQVGNQTFDYYYNFTKEEVTFELLNKECLCIHCFYISFGEIKEFNQPQQCSQLSKEEGKYSCVEYDCGLSIVEYS